MHGDLLRRNKKNEKKKNDELSRIAIEHDITPETANSSISSAGSNLSPKAKKSMKFSITMTWKKWQTISPVRVSYDRKSTDRTKSSREKYVLKPGIWTNIFKQQIAKQIKNLPCRFVFENCNVCPNGERFIKIHAHCKVCQSKLIGSLRSKPDENEDVRFECSLLNLDKSKHMRKNQPSVKLYGEAAKEIYSRKQTAARIVKEMAHENMEMFQLPATTIPSENAVRCGKSRIRKQEALDDDPLTALDMLQLSTKYRFTIRAKGNNPFYVIYMSQEQIEMLKAYKKHNEDNFVKFSADATGKIVRKFSE